MVMALMVEMVLVFEVTAQLSLAKLVFAAAQLAVLLAVLLAVWQLAVLQFAELMLVVMLVVWLFALLHSVLPLVVRLAAAAEFVQSVKS
eukprot:SAG11_NODE_13087_length_670_cov_178.973730_1_plen_89_part_00